MIDFSSLGPAKFESLCYDLLSHLGLRNLQWRKGQNEGCASSDSGRDIEGEIFRRDIDGAVLTEKWFVECKHWTKAVSPTAIHGLFTWSDAERPDVVVVISSGVLSNGAHDWIKAYRRENRPPYVIKEWEQKTLEALLSSFPDILLDYGIPSPYTSPLLHTLWRDLRVHTLDYLFSLLDGIAEDQRDKMVGTVVYFSVLPLRARQPVTGKERVGDLLIDPPNYDKFKRRCYELVSDEDVNESFLVSAIVATASRWLASRANPLEMAQGASRCRKALELAENDIERIEAGGDFTALQNISRKDYINSLRKSVDHMRAHIVDYPSLIAESREILNEWERQVVIPLLNEDPLHALRDFDREANEAQ